MKISRRIYFWDLEQSSNRLEYNLKSQDNRLMKMYEDGVVELVIHSSKTRGIFKKLALTI